MHGMIKHQMIHSFRSLPQKPTADDFKVYAVSIDKLEMETGIDFFCNLVDSVENAIEAAYDFNDWIW